MKGKAYRGKKEIALYTSSGSTMKRQAIHVAEDRIDGVLGVKQNMNAINLHTQKTNK